MSAKAPLSVTHPGLAAQLIDIDPAFLTAGSNKKLSWKCEKGHVWDAKVSNRAIKGYGCPICSGQQILSGVNDLATLFSEIAKEAFDWDSSLVSPHSNRKLKWKCHKGHIWESTVTNRTTRGDGCAVCSNHKTQPGFNDLATTDPKLAQEAFGWDPKTKSRSSNKKVDWKCTKGHIFSATVGSRTSGSGCPVCAGRKVEVGFNDLATLNPSIAAEAYGWSATNYTKSSNQKLMWKCKKGHIWETSIGNRARGTSCPICIGKKVLVGFNDLDTQRPDLAKEAFGWDPKTVTIGSTRKNLEWKCTLGHVWKSTVARRTSGSKCPYCSGQKAFAGFNDLATTHPEIAAEAFGWDPTTIMAGTEKKLAWQCPKGHVYRSRGAERKNGNNCPFCSGQKVLVGFNDLATTHPQVAVQAFGWNPTTVRYGTSRKMEWICEKGHKWKTGVGHRTSGKATGCPTCAQTGFDPNIDGWLYFLEHEGWGMLQIGITNSPEQRIAKHRKLGWTLIDLAGPMDGLLARGWESSILRMLKKAGAKIGDENIAGKFDGYTEAWIEKSFPSKSLNELMKQVQANE